MTGNDYNIALMIFFPSYIVFEVPSNILIKRLAPSTWLSLIMFLWGVITICEGLVQTKTQLYTLTILQDCWQTPLRTWTEWRDTQAGDG